MDGVDYTKALNRQRQKYHKDLKELRQSNERNVDNLQDSHETTQKKMSKNYQKSKNALEDKFESKIGGFRERTQQALADKRERFANEIEEKQSEFSKVSRDQKQNFDERLKTIKGEYEENIERKEVIDKDLRAGISKNFGERISNLRDNTQKDISAIQDRALGSSSELHKEFQEEKKHLVKDHLNEKEDLLKTETEKKIILQNRIREDVARMRKAQESEVERLNRVSDQNFKKLVGRTNKKVDDAFVKFDDENRRQSEVVKKSQKELMKENQKKLDDLREKQRNELARIALKQKRSSQSEDEFGEFSKLQQGQKSEKHWEQKIASLKDQHRRERELFDKKVAENNQKYQEANLRKTIEFSNQKEADEIRHSTNRMKTISAEREEKADIRKAHAFSERNLIGDYEKKLETEKNSSDRRYNRLLDDFNNKVETLSEENKNTAANVKAEAIKDKKEFAENFSERQKENNYELRKDFSDKFNSSSDAYQWRITALESENDSLKQELFDRTNDLRAEADREIALQKEISEETRKADRRSFDVQSTKQERDFQEKLERVHLGYRTKLNELSYSSNKQIDRLTRDYENKLKKLQADTSRKLREHDNHKNNEIEQLKSSFETEKMRIVGQYESQMQSSRRGYEQQLERLSNYKKEPLA